MLDLARQIKDLLNASAVWTGRPVRMLAIGDRDYRTDSTRRRELSSHTRRAKSPAFEVDLRLRLWEANEIENYLLDRDALLATLDRQALAQGINSTWKKHRKDFLAELESRLTEQREAVRQAMATRIQNEDRRLMLSTALDRADDFLLRAWEHPDRWCDAKYVIARLRNWLQERGLALRIADDKIIDAMTSVPDDVQKILRELQRMSNIRATRRTRRLPAAGD